MTKSSGSIQATNSHKEDGAVLLARNVLALLGCGMRMFLDHVIRRHECDLFREEGVNVELFAHNLLCVIEGLVDAYDVGLEGLHVALFRCNHLLPVPLVNIQRVSEVHLHGKKDCG